MPAKAILPLTLRPWIVTPVLKYDLLFEAKPVKWVGAVGFCCFQIIFLFWSLRPTPTSKAIQHPLSEEAAAPNVLPCLLLPSLALEAQHLQPLSAPLLFNVSTKARGDQSFCARSRCPEIMNQKLAPTNCLGGVRHRSQSLPLTVLPRRLHAANSTLRLPLWCFNVCQPEYGQSPAQQ